MKLSELIGQERALKRLKPLLSTRKLPPALLFAGPRGVGKCAAALAFAAALNCDRKKADACGDCPSCALAARGSDPDLRRVNAAYQAALREEEEAKQRQLRVETIRHLIADLELRSLEGRWKIAVIEDAHTLVPAAANAMLKTLEEPPPRTLWILVTHRPAELLPTIRSRCQRVAFAPLAEAAILGVLKARGVAAPEAAAAAALAEGSCARALELLAEPQPEPDSWLSDPVGPFRLADKLPKELFKARPAAEEQLHRMAWHLRRRRGTRAYASAAVRSVLRELGEYRAALASNADPRLVLSLAALRIQQLEAAHPAGAA